MYLSVVLCTFNNTNNVFISFFHLIFHVDVHLPRTQYGILTGLVQERYELRENVRIHGV